MHYKETDYAITWHDITWYHRLYCNMKPYDMLLCHHAMQAESVECLGRALQQQLGDALAPHPTAPNYATMCDATVLVRPVDHRRPGCNFMSGVQSVNLSN